MARTSKSRGATPFSMRSGKRTTFKMMGSSPMRVDPTEVVTMGEETVVGTTTTEMPKSTSVKTDYQTKGTGYTPPSELMSDEDWNKMSKAEQNAMDEKYKKAHTRNIIEKRSETKSKSKELTPQQKLATGSQHEKYYDTAAKEYRVRVFANKNVGTEKNPKYSSQGRGKQKGDMSLAEWKEQNTSLASEGTKGTKF